MDRGKHFDYLLMVYQDGRAELIDNSSIACTTHGDYAGVGLPKLEELIMILKNQGKIEVMSGYDYPADVIREMTVQEFRNANVYLMNHKRDRSPITPIERLDIDF